MATSGSFNFNLTRNEIITEAYGNLGIVADGQELEAEQIATGNKQLNLMIKGWRAKGISLPLYQDLTLYLNASQQTYLLGATGDELAVTDDAKKIELAVAGVASDGTITVDSDDNIANGDYIGIVLDDNTIQWTTVNGTPASNVVTLTTALTGAAAIDNHVYTYTTQAQRPLTIQGARIKINDGNEIPVNVLTRQEYMALSNKTSTGVINSIYYDPQITNGVLYVYPTANSVKDTLLLTVQRQIADFDVSTDNADFPVEWLEPIIWNLSARLMFRYGVDAQTRAEIGRVADNMLFEIEAFDQEDSIQFTPYGNTY